MSQSIPNSRIHFLCYKLGIAIGQAKQLHDEGMPSFNSEFGFARENTPEDVPAFESALVVLRARLIAFADEMECSTDWRQLATKLVDRALDLWHWCSELSRDDLIRLDPQPVSTKLSELIQLLSLAIVERPDALAETWFHLGTIVPAGHATEKYIMNWRSHTEAKDGEEPESTDCPEVPETHQFSLNSTGEYEWSPRHPDHIEKLCKTIGVSPCQLLPDIDITDQPEVLPNLSPEFQWAFKKMAAGATCLFQDRGDHSGGVNSSIESQGPSLEMPPRDSNESKRAHLDIELDSDRRVVTRIGQDAEVDLSHSPVLWSLLKCLVSRRLAWTGRSDLNDVWKDSVPEDSTVDGAFSDLRIQLRVLGVKITNRRKTGWRLESAN